MFFQHAGKEFWENLYREDELFTTSLENFTSELINEYYYDNGKEILDYLDVKPDERLLVLGSGSMGPIALPAAERGIQTTCVDICDYALKRLYRRAKRRGIEKNINIVCLDINEEWPFEPDAFDVVTSIRTMMHINDIENTLSELLRVSTKDRKVYLTEVYNIASPYIKFLTTWNRIQHCKNIFLYGHDLTTIEKYFSMENVYGKNFLNGSKLRLFLKWSFGKKSTVFSDLLSSGIRDNNRRLADYWNIIVRSK